MTDRLKADTDLAGKREPRLSREDWLARALDILAQEGNAKLRIDAICKALGVTKGSFYWHFESREDFQRSLVEYWSRTFTALPLEAMRRVEGDARERLLRLMEIVREKGLARYELSVRAWARMDLQLAEIVRDVDRLRFAYVRSQFAEMGFAGIELDMRTRLFVVSQSLDVALHDETPAEDRDELMQRSHALLTRP